MKRILFSFLCFLFAFAVQAQDLIVKSNGKEISAKVVEIGNTEVKYEQAGQIYSLPKSDILRIIYANGKSETFGQSSYKGAPVEVASAGWKGTAGAGADISLEPKYRRSSLYSILVKYASTEFCTDIVDVFYSIPIPDKFDDHNLKIRDINAYIPRNAEQQKAGQQKENVENFLLQNEIGRRLVAKWFDRDSRSGAFNLNLIFERGFNNASVSDIRIAEKSARGIPALADAGEELIGNTFIIVNDIRYVDKDKHTGLATAGLASSISELGAVTGVDTKEAVKEVNAARSAVSKKIEGFEVNVTSYLYRLNWTDDIAGVFYQNYWVTNASPDASLKGAFDNDKSTFTISYVGSQTVSSGNTSLLGINTKANETTIRREMIKKVCTRAIDDAIVQLQRNFDEFKVKMPLTSTSPITAYIGKKEGVTEDAKYEVLERQEDAKGRASYRRVGIVQPVKGKIWDNRYLSVEEGFEGAGLGATEFKKVSGDNFYPGMLIREIK